MISRMFQISLSMSDFWRGWPLTVIANLSSFFELRPGDLIYTGTPEGVGKIERGQTMVGGIDGLGELSVKVV